MNSFKVEGVLNPATWTCDSKRPEDRIWVTGQGVEANFLELGPALCFAFEAFADPVCRPDVVSIVQSGKSITISVG